MTLRFFCRPHLAEDDYRRRSSEKWSGRITSADIEYSRCDRRNVYHVRLDGVSQTRPYDKGKS